MSESDRVQRWREAKRQKGMKALTVWLTDEEELRLKDLALTCHCSPSALVQQALAQFTPTRLQDIGRDTDMLPIRELLQEQIATLQAEVAAMQARLATTHEGLATVTETVTEAVTATLARELPALVRQHVAELALEAIGVPVTDTDGNDTDTEEIATDTSSDVTDTLWEVSADGQMREYVTVAGNSLVTETEPTPHPDAPPTAETRRERILAAVPREGERGITIAALADQLRLDYNTVKNDIRTLRQHKQVLQSTGAQGGGYVRPR